MYPRQGVWAFASALLHHTVVSAPARAHHEAFIAQALTVAFTALAIAPFSLAFRGVPTPAEILIFMLCVSQLAAAMLVVRTGRLIFGQIVCVVGLIGISLTLGLGMHAGAACALAWLIPAQLEAMQSTSRPLSRICTAVTVAAAGLIVANAHSTPATGLAAPFSVAVMTGFGLLQVLFLARRPMATIAMMDIDACRQSERWDAISEALGDAIVSFAPDGSVTHVTSGCGKLLGAAQDDLTGRALFDHVHVGDRPRFLKLVADAAQGDAVVTDTIGLRTLNSPINARGFEEPRSLCIELRARRLVPAEEKDPNRHNCPASVIAVLRDVTAMREQALEVDAARQSIEAAIRSKDHFLATMSHELRTPLNAIIGFSEMLASRTLCPSDPDKRRDYARIINQSGQHLLSVVNAILDMSKIQLGTFSIIPEPFEAASLIDLCCDMVALKAEDGGIQVERDYFEELEPLVGDKRACKQILINLLSNAVKFTPRGGRVTISARPEGNALLLAVADTGIGIAAADLPLLGNAFFQALPTLSRPFEGTGLGLSVVRGLVGLHGGTIAIESERGKGTVVTVRLPLDCRIIKSRNDAAIETIARRASSKPVFHESRMKQSA